MKYFIIVILLSLFLLIRHQGTYDLILGGLGLAFVVAMGIKSWADEKLAQLITLKKGN